VEIVGKDFRATADTAVIDADQIWVELTGRVVIGSESMRTTATSVAINVETNDWRVEGGRTEIQPGFFDGTVAEPIYVSAGHIETPPDRNIIEAFGATATSCTGQ
jgi:lipopolysaccharide export system protein LptA